MQDAGDAPGVAVDGRDGAGVSIPGAGDAGDVGSTGNPDSTTASVRDGGDDGGDATQSGFRRIGSGSGGCSCRQAGRSDPGRPSALFVTLLVASCGAWRIRRQRRSCRH
jgi:hypothetical protein